MLIDNDVSLLLVAFDDVPDLYNQFIPAVAADGGKGLPNTEEVLNSQTSASRILMSDIADRTTRIPIPITDAIWDVHYVSGQSSQSQGVITQTKTEKPSTAEGGSKSVIEKTFTPGRCTSVLQFELKNNLTAISTVADVLTALAGMNVTRIDNYPRASFFSGHRCVFNARIVGVNRANVPQSNKEIITLTLEEGFDDIIELPDVELGTIADADAAKDFVLENTSGVTQAVEDHATSSEQVFEFDVYDYYGLDSIDNFDNTFVPDYDTKQTIQRQKYRLLRVNSFDNSGAKRGMLTIEFQGEFIALEDSVGDIKHGDLHLIKYVNSYFLGVRK